MERLKADAAASTVTMAPPHGANPPTWGSANPSPNPSPGRGSDYGNRPAYTLPPTGGKSWMSGIPPPAAAAPPPPQQYLSRGASEGGYGGSWGGEGGGGGGSSGDDRSGGGGGGNDGDGGSDGGGEGSVRETEREGMRLGQPDLAFFFSLLPPARLNLLPSTKYLVFFLLQD